MKHLYTSLLFVISICCTGYSQIESEKTIFKSVGENQTVTVTLDYRPYERNIIGELKDDLISFNEKVISVTLDEEGHLLYITYNDKMLLKDLEETFRKHNVQYVKTGKGKSAKTKHEQL